MSSHQSLFPIAACGLTAFTLIATIFFSSDFAAAAEPSHQPNPLIAKDCPRTDIGNQTRILGTRPGQAARLSLIDEISALESLRIALNEIADGGSFVWHSDNGHLSGVVNPVSSFKNAEGGVCRHLVVVFSSDYATRKTETVACRHRDGVWQLDG